MSSSITVYCAITTKNGERVPLQMSTTSTCTELRQQAAEVTKIPLDQLRLIFRGKMIKDEAISAVETYKLEPECVLHCMGKPIETAAAAVGTSVASLPSVAAAVPTLPVASAASPPVPTVDPLQTALQQLRSFHAPQVYATALSTLAKILANIADHPMEEKYRKVKQQNVAFAKRLGGLNGGDAAMRAVGFILEQQEGVPVYQLHASPEAWPKLMATKATIDAAAVEAERLLTTNPTPPPMPASGTAGMGNSFGGLPGMGALPGANAINNNPAMQAAMANMLSNPEAMRAMLQNPMVQQMIQNDPNVPPHLRTAMQQIGNNPAMLNQLSAMMSDPAMRAQIQTMMGSGAMPGAANSAMGMGNFARPPVPPAANSNNSNTNNNSNSPINDQQQTEEEMIAEAIRRSLEES